MLVGVVVDVSYVMLDLEGILHVGYDIFQVAFIGVTICDI